jgi:hypothetical protein
LQARVRSEAMGDTLRWYTADALLEELTSQHHHLRAASEEEAEQRMRRRYPQAVAVLALLEESWRQELYPSSRRKRTMDKAAARKMIRGT